MNMIPMKIYLTKQELQDTTTCEKMVSIEEPYRDMIMEYIDINQMWYDTSKEPKDGSHILMQYNYEGDKELKSFHIKYNKYMDWQKLVRFYGISRWAYVSDLLPKGLEN